MHDRSNAYLSHCSLRKTNGAGNDCNLTRKDAETLKGEGGKNFCPSGNTYKDYQDRQSKIILREYNHKRFKTLMTHGKNNVPIFTGLLTGHCRLHNHLHYEII